MVDREARINLRASEEEAAMLRALAERDGISASDFLRLYIRRAYREAFGSPRSMAEAVKLHNLRADTAAAAPLLDALPAPPPKATKKTTKPTK
jgi:uncharacterized protein (DUF1778 family)